MATEGQDLQATWDKRAAEDEQLRGLFRRLGEVLGKEHATTLMTLLVGEYRTTVLERSLEESSAR